MLFHVEVTLRYTRLSCRPFRATLELRRVVQARERDDVVRQVGLCLDRDLEELLAEVNTLNVSEVLVDVGAVRPLDHGEGEGADLWNPEPFEQGLIVPRHLVLRAVG